MVNISPSIYIGLGGAGIIAISQTKKMYEDAFGKGNIPGQIAFVAIDFDLSIIHSPDLATDIRDDFVMPEHLENIRQIYEEGVAQGKFQWMFDGNVKYVHDGMYYGVARIRQIGRLLTEINIGCITRKIDDRVNQIMGFLNASSNNVNEDVGIGFHIVMSFAGGTGGGAFLSIAFLIRHLYPNQTLLGYGILHGIFRTITPFVTMAPWAFANSYAAVLDLDYLMTASQDNPINLEVNGNLSLLDRPLYDMFYIIDNETEAGRCVDDIHKLCDLLGTGLFCALGRCFKPWGGRWWMGHANILNKLGWVQTLGVCQVVFKGDLLAEIYGLKAAKEIIRKLIGSKADIEKDVIQWSEEVGIREEGDNNRLIDGIYAPEKIVKVKEPDLDINDSLTIIKNAVNKYLNTFPDDYPTEKAIEDKASDVITRLRAKLTALLNAENGIGNSLGFLNSLEWQLKQFKNEMNSEKSVFEKKYADAIDAMERNNFKEYEEYTKKFFVFRRKKQENLEEMIARPAQRILKDRLELERRRSAYEVFIKILAAAAELKQKTEEIDKKLRKLEVEYQYELGTKQSSSQSSLIFEIDLSRQERLTMDFNRRDVFISDFINDMGKSLFDIDLHKELDLTIRNYVNTLCKANDYRNRLIIDMINELNELEQFGLKAEIINRSSCLLRLDNRGQKHLFYHRFPTELLTHNYIITIYEDKKGWFENLKISKGWMNTDYLPLDFDFLKQKIIIIRSEESIIPYCISAFDELTVEKEYTSLITDALQENSTSFNPHFDKELFLEMKSKDFKLKPEMQNEAMFYWVCGSLFGWQTVMENKYIMQKDSNGNPAKLEKTEEVEHTKYIRIKEGRYYFWNEDGETIKPDVKWVSINNTRQRDQAFTFFKTEILPQIKQTLQTKIKHDIRKLGKHYYDALIEGIINAGKFDYIDTLICSDKNSLTYYTQGKGDEKQFDEEWRFIEKHLKKAVSFL
jgi:hypothetical protein